MALGVTTISVVRRLRTPDHVVDRFRTATSMVAAGLGVMVGPAISITGSRVTVIRKAPSERTSSTLDVPHTPVTAPPPTTVP